MLACCQQSVVKSSHLLAGVRAPGVQRDMVIILQQRPFGLACEPQIRNTFRTLCQPADQLADVSLGSSSSNYADRTGVRHLIESNAGHCGATLRRAATPDTVTLIASLRLLVR